MSRRVYLGLWFLVLGLPGRLAAQPADFNESLEKAMKEAARKVAPSVVQIVTQGGADLVVTGPKGPAFRKALGPTTGVIVSADGYVISSAFNFVNNPTTILISVPGKPEPLVARRLATDRARMLTLLKIEATGLPVAAIVPRKDLRVGQWSIALGRALDVKRDSPPAICVGIISALDRIWSRAFQTDAKISPVNYGGPLIDLQGRIQGILIPASPRGEGETAGFEWYDSGIGFAIPMEDVLAALPRLKAGKDLHKAVLGIRPKSGDMFSALPEVGDVTKGSAADAAGLKPGDIIVELDGKPVVRMAQVLHILGPKYEGDKISLKYKRGGKVIAVDRVEFAGAVRDFTHPFLGILPMRDDPALGVEVRFVYPKSPAEKASIKPGDRIVKVGMSTGPLRSFSGQKPGRTELTDLLNTLSPGTTLKLEVLRKDKKVELTLSLDAFPGTVKGSEDAILDKLPDPASLKKALAPLEGPKGKGKPAPPPPEPKEKAAIGLVSRATADGHKFWIYVPENYDPNIAHALVVWLHPPGKHRLEDLKGFAGLWEDFCKDKHLILLLPSNDQDSGWVPSDTDFVIDTVRDVLNSYTIDRQRLVAHGMGVGGQMAVYLGFHVRDLFRAVAGVGAVATQVKNNVANQRLAFFLAAGEKDPLVKASAQSKDDLARHHIPAVFRLIPDRGREYFDAERMRELVRWIDALDRL